MFPGVAECFCAVWTVWTAAETAPASDMTVGEAPSPCVSAVMAWRGAGAGRPALGLGSPLSSTATPPLWFFISPQNLLALHNPHILILKGLSFTDSLAVSHPVPLSINCCAVWKCSSWQFSVEPQLVRHNIVNPFLKDKLPYISLSEHSLLNVCRFRA